PCALLAPGLGGEPVCRAGDWCPVHRHCAALHPGPGAVPGAVAPWPPGQPGAGR
ncbi:hypothetical protein, partial [Simplicispira piscis]